MKPLGGAEAAVKLFKMGGLRIIQLALVAIALSVVYGKVNQVPLPDINLNEWWGPGKAPATQNTSIWNFEIKFTDEMINDLKYRLQNHRPFTPPLEGIAQQYGFNSDLLKNWTNYLATEYPFKDRETYLNQYTHHKTCLQGICLHFIRVQSQNNSIILDNVNKNRPRYTPLLLLHGWPGSVREFYDAIPILISLGESRGIALDVIVPSLPGFGFSSAATKPGLGVDKCAVVFRNLMHRLGYSQFYVQAGDMGAMTANCIATLFQNEVLGYHTNLPFLYTPDMIFRLILGNLHKEEITTPELLPRLYPSWDKFFGSLSFNGYLHIQATKPDTVGVGLTDSPSALMAYTFEKVSACLRKTFITYPDAGLTEILTAEQILDNYMIYWSTNCINTAIRLYSETFNKRYLKLRINEITTTVPMWVMQAPDELGYIPAWMIKLKYVNLLGETLPSEGGHFYAWEKPRPYAEDVVNAIVAFKQFHENNSTLYEKCSAYISNY